MLSANELTPNQEAEDLSPEEIQQTFQQLGLDDPAARERLLRLAAEAEQQQQTADTWMDADSGTGHLD